jgi:histidinol dehydrogenase
VSKPRLIKVWRTPSLPPSWAERGKILERKTAQPLERRVKSIIEEVKTQGDAALIKFTKKFDKTTLDARNLRITREEIEEAYEAISQKQISALEFMKEKVATVEKRTLEQIKIKVEENGIRVRNLPRPIQSVGCYVPGGEAAYPSTLVMTVVPAKVAGVPRVVVCSPPTAKGSINPLIVVAADICKADEIYKVGGAQAIAALAYGTESIKPVKKIVGPGNIYVTMAKILVSRDVAIDMPAGPSEILILADATASPRLVALDLISQAEHGADSVAGLITTSKELAENVLNELRKITSSVERGAIVKKALSSYGFIITCKATNEMIELANTFAPEHAEIITQKPEEVADKIVSAGLILIGPYSPVSLSDYCTGTNHVLPTSGFGHAFSGLSVLDFIRRVGIVECSKEGLLKLKNNVKVLAEAENLPNHYKAIEGRINFEDSR